MSNKGTDKYGTPPTEEDFAAAEDRLNLTDKLDDYVEEGIRSEEEWFRLANYRTYYHLGYAMVEAGQPNNQLGRRNGLEDAKPVGQRHKVSALAELTIPAKYAEFEAMFTEPAIKDALPKHQPWDHKIPLMPGKNPEKQPIYVITPANLEVLRKYIDENKAKGWIQESQSPVGYPILFLCATTDIRTARPLARGQMVYKFDIPAAYHQIRIKAGEEWKTAFCTHLGHYKYQVMPFGLTNAPATFQSYINNVLQKYLDVFVTVYIDDILIYSETEEEHRVHVRKVLTALNKEGIQLKREKSKFHKQEIGFLGCIIRPGELRMDPSKVTVITEWPEPKTVKDMQSFLGFANFYRRFIEKYSQKATPLTNLTKKEQPFQWNEEHQQAFKAIREAFTNGKVLHIFDPELATEVETDASDGAIGACLGQRKDKKLVPIAFYSRKLTPPEQNYKIHDKELLAIVDALKQWQVYLEGSKGKVKVYLDHKNLESFTTTKVLNQRQVRWSEELATYHFWIYYQNGSLNGRADALSRRADYVTDLPKTAGQILEVDANGNLAYHRQQIAATFEIADPEGENLIQEALTKDKAVQDLCQVNQEPGSLFEYEDGILWFDGKCYYGKFVPYLEGSTAEELAYAIYKNVVADHGLPMQIITDRDKLVVSKFWQSLMDLMGVQHKLSTAYHPQTDGQTERLNQTLEQYLQNYVNYQQDNWNATIRCTPFYANYGFEADVKNVPRGLQSVAQRAKVKVKHLIQLHQQLHQDIAFTSQQTAKYYNNKRKKGPSLKEGDKKLDHTKLGPFHIKKKLGPDVYKLQLPDTIDTPDTANGGEGAAAEAGNSNDTDDDIEAATAHNQEVIDCQRRQIRRVQQDIKYEENKRELERLNARRREGLKATTTASENNGGFTPGPREPRPYAGGPKGSRHQLQEYLDEINQSRELMPEQFPTKWDFIVWAGTYLEKTAMSDWQRQKEQHDCAWVTYDNYLKVLEQNLSPGEDTDEQNIVAFNAAEPNANNTITSWYEKLYKLYRFLPDTYKQMGKAPIQDRWRAQLPHHVLTELQR
ncbi:Ribonuclease H-like domain [Lasallia pustulata]|uniref:Ribonuclease H-like domain n=1 Tax=Lasallia pustulata TaxID=136370 RepID=A0A1W5CRC0_9LECA|nr:Ribonuclease H-like domain [Lasallia pustulata]